MLKVPLLKAGLSRWGGMFNVLSIGKWLPLLITPIALLYAYAHVQAAQRQVAEHRVEQLTADLRILAGSLAQVERYVNTLQQRSNEHATRTQVLSNETDDVLGMPAPESVVTILRPTATPDPTALPDS